MQEMMSRSLRQIEPLVRHGLQELREGTTLEHTLREVAIMGAMVGAGATANQAVRTLERLESRVLGGVGQERGETTYHTGLAQQGYVQPGLAQQSYGKPSVLPQTYGKQMPMTYGKPSVLPQTYGKPGVATQAYGKPSVVPQMYGKPGVGAQTYGKQMPMTYGPMGTTWMGK